MTFSWLNLLKGWSLLKTRGDSSSEVQRLHSVDEGILTAGSKKQQQADARRFLASLGVRIPNEADVMAQLLEDFYSKGSTPPNDLEYRKHFEAMISFLERNPSQKDLFTHARVFKVDSVKMTWASAQSVYLDEPYIKSGLRELYSLGIVAAQKERLPLDSSYQHFGVPIEKIVKFADFLGCQREFDQLVSTSYCHMNPNWSYLCLAPGGRAGNGIDRDFALSKVAHFMLQTQKLETVQLVWRALCRSETAKPSILTACYQLTEKGGPRFSPSQLVSTLKELAWVPQTDGTFVKPRLAIARNLPKGFSVDAGYKWMEAVDFGADDKKLSAETAVRAEHRKELGFESEDELARALEFKELPKEEQEKILAEAKRRRAEPIELPERPVKNPDLRRARVGADVQATPEKTSAMRERSVPLGVNEAKAEAKAYLRDQYTNSNGQMICQVCKDELPFKLATGSYYFEAVELIENSQRRYRATYLALCPNHAAAFQYANAQRNSMSEVVATAASNEVEIALGGRETTIYFTQMHLADAKASLNSDDGEDV